MKGKIQKKLEAGAALNAWLVEHAAVILSRCRRGNDGRTSFERIHGKAPTQQMLPVGEEIWFRPLTASERSNKGGRHL